MADTRTVKSNLTYKGTPRHLLVFMDGTWNDENGRDNEVSPPIFTNCFGR